MTTTTPGSTNATVAAADRLRALADVIDVVGHAPHTVYNLAEIPEAHVLGRTLESWLEATGIPAPVVYTPAGTALWEHEDGTWRPTSPTTEGGFCLRHVDLSKTQPGV